MIEIAIKKERTGFFTSPWTVKRNIPECWTDLTAADRLRYLRFLITLPRPQALMEITKAILALPRRRFRQLPPEVFVQVTDRIAWMNADATSEPLFTSFEYQGVRYHLPAAKFKNGTCLEYPIADDYYNSFVNGDNDALLLLTATLCRKAKDKVNDIARSGDIRIEMLSRSEAEANAVRLAGLPIEIQVGVMLYFAGVKQYIFDTYAGWIFKKPDPDEEESETTEQGDGVMFGWWGVYFDIAESGVFGNLQQVYQSNFHTICMYMTKKKKEADDAERRQALANTSTPSDI
jgi:hypothetical protein